MKAGFQTVLEIREWTQSIAFTDIHPWSTKNHRREIAFQNGSRTAFGPSLPVASREPNRVVF
jgi:hypothetical protein